MIFYFFYFVYFLLPYAQKPSYEATPNNVGLRMRNSHFCMLNLMFNKCLVRGCDFYWFLKTIFFPKTILVVKYKNAFPVNYFIFPLALQYTRAKTQAAVCPVPFCAYSRRKTIFVWFYQAVTNTVRNSLAFQHVQYF